MAYTLGPRQKRFFIHTFSLWKPATLGVDSSKSLVDPSWHLTPTYSGIRGFFWSTDNVNEPRQQGLTKQTNIFTDDKLRLHALQDIASAWLVKMTGSKTSGDPDIGRYWVVQGAPNVDTFRSMELTCYLVAAATPNFSADPT